MQTADPLGTRTTFDDPATQATRADRRSVAELLSDLWRGTTSLVHDEIALARAELADKGREFAVGAGEVAKGGAILFAGFIVLLLAATNALAMVLPRELAPWLAPLIVGVVVMLVGYGVLSGGRRRAAAANLPPSRSMDSLRQDRNIVKDHLP